MKETKKKDFIRPVVERWGTVHNLTAVGNTMDGEDEFPGRTNPNETGSNCNPSWACNEDESVPGT